VAPSGSTLCPPKFHRHPTRPRPTQTLRLRSFKGTIPEHGVAARMEIRESGPERKPAIVSNVNGEQISRSFLAAWERRRVPRDRLSRVAETPAAPPAPTIQCIRYSQNVAGMWLKCGQGPKHRDFLASQKTCGRCDSFLKMSVDNPDGGGL